MRHRAAESSGRSSTAASTQRTHISPLERCRILACAGCIATSPIWCAASLRPSILTPARRSATRSATARMWPCIIGGELPAGRRAVIATSRPTVEDLPNWVARDPCDSGRLAGVAPQARLVSLRVLEAGADGDATTVSSAVIAALAWVREANADGRMLRIHGVNLSLGCPWFPDEFAADQSPLCQELNQLV